MRKLLFFLIFIAVLAYLYTRSPKIQSFVYFSPCDTPIKYKLGSIDPKFNLTQDQFKKDIDQATTIWDQTEGKNLFVFDPAAELTVSMIYDERQYLSSQLDQLGNSLDKMGSNVNSMENSLDTQKKSLDQQVADFEKQKADFTQKLAEYNQEVASINSRGGATAEEFDKLEKERAALNAQQTQLNSLADSLNAQADQYNGNVDQLRKSIADYNNKVGTFNQTASVFKQEVSQHPEEGLYDGKNQTISIYYNTSHDELVHTLTHEFGHSLGLEHNQNKDSIMYPFTTTKITPTQDDLAALQKVCQKETIFTVLFERLRQVKLQLNPNS